MCPPDLGRAHAGEVPCPITTPITNAPYAGAPSNLTQAMNRPYGPACGRRGNFMRKFSLRVN